MSGDWLQHMRAQQVGAPLATCAAGTVVAYLWGASELSFPSGTAAGSISMPLWVLLPLPLAASVVAGRWTRMKSQRDAAARRLWGFDIAYVLTGLALAAGGLVAGLTASGLGAAISEAVRNLAFWAGLALLSTIWCEPRLCWSFPLAVLFPLDWYGFDVTTGAPHWWAAPMVEASVFSWAAALVLLGIGMVSVVPDAWGRQWLGRLLWISRPAHAGAGS